MLWVFCHPKLKELQSQLMNIASSVMLDSNNHLRCHIQKGFPAMYIENLFCLLIKERLDHCHAFLLPSAEEVIGMFSFEQELRPEQDRVVYALQTLLRSLYQRTSKSSFSL